MNLNRINSLVCRIFFIIAFLLLVIPVIEKIANLAGYTFLRGSSDPGRLLEFGAILIIFVVALLLRQIREELKKQHA
jgi:TRAP-type mannitol/chloroaromatic compound transport system permease small subunit